MIQEDKVVKIDGSSLYGELTVSIVVLLEYQHNWTENKNYNEEGVIENTQKLHVIVILIETTGALSLYDSWCNIWRND